MIPIEHLLVAASLLLLLSILASKLSSRLGIPALLLFLVLGMLAGSDGPGGIWFDNPWLAQSLGVVALALILFAGGMDTHWQTVRPAIGQGLALSTVGVLVTALSVGGFAVAVLGFAPLEGILLGAIVSSTDAAAVFAILRSRSTRLKEPLEPLLEMESGSNDPMAVFLTIGMIRLLTDAAASPFALIGLFAQQMIIGVALGYGIGQGSVFIINRLRLEYEGLYPVLTLTLALLTYGVTTSLGGNGFLAVYLAGLILGNSSLVHKKSLARFHDGLAWLMQIVMFLTLGLLVFPSRLIAVIPAGLLAAAFLMLVARPLSVLIALLPARLSLREKSMVAWVGLRGAAPIILATFPLVEGLPKADTIFHLVFFIVLTSVLLQGTSLPLVARWLRVDAPASSPHQPILELAPAANIKNELTELTVPTGSSIVGRQIVDLGLPPGTLIVLLGRQGDFIIPGGSTVIEAGDRLLVLAGKDAFTRLRDIVSQSVETGITEG